MNYAVVLAGGIGSRLDSEVPKQYIVIKGKPIIFYCLETLNDNEDINGIVIVAANQWHAFLKELIKKYNLTKVIGFATAGPSREHSVLNGFRYLAQNNVNDDDIVLVHDAARPLLTNDVINNCIVAMHSYDAVLPALKEKNALYLSTNGDIVSGTVNRNELFCGQTPECFRFGKYYSLMNQLNDSELENVKGCSELAYRKGLIVGLIPGYEKLYKITTAEDLEEFRKEILCKY